MKAASLSAKLGIILRFYFIESTNITFLNEWEERICSQIMHPRRRSGHTTANRHCSQKSISSSIHRSFSRYSPA